MKLTNVIASIALVALTATSSSAGGFGGRVSDEEIVIPPAIQPAPAGSFGSLGSGGVVLPAILGLAVIAAIAAGSSGGGS
jgi:hypothetical protein